MDQWYMDLWLAGSMDLLAWMGSACAVHMLSTSVYSGNLPDEDGEVLGRLEQMSLGLSPRAAAARPALRHAHATSGSRP